jgi:hypothetical protein
MSCFHLFFHPNETLRHFVMVSAALPPKASTVTQEAVQYFRIPVLLCFDRLPLLLLHQNEGGLAREETVPRLADN